MESMNGEGKPFEILAIRVHQWLETWNDVKFDVKDHRRKPEPHFYMFTMSATNLLSLSDIYRRGTNDRTLDQPDLGIQRHHTPSRSNEIKDFVQGGYPLSGTRGVKKESKEYVDLLKPGWLPTAIVVNILTDHDFRRGKKVASKDLIHLVADSEDEGVRFRLPSSWTDDTHWTPSDVAPIEVIDGQHRLLAFAGDSAQIDFELPVVAFYGLDISWQAYLFWTINIRPKRINPSLAFDLYPLLRTESWLENVEGHAIYRETRSQELTEVLWAHPESPWAGRINMLGESGHGGVTQNAWVRSLTASYVKAWEGKRTTIGGLFGARLEVNEDVLGWGRVQQAAFLIYVWQRVQDSVKRVSSDWAELLRASRRSKGALANVREPAFDGPFSLLNTDQGVRAVLQVTNDLCFVQATSLDLQGWRFDPSESMSEDQTINESVVTDALSSLRNQPVAQFIDELAETLAEYDWRTAGAESLGEDERAIKLGFRGSGGYKELRRQLLRHLEQFGDATVSKAAQQTIIALGY